MGYEWEEWGYNGFTKQLSLIPCSAFKPKPETMVDVGDWNMT
jgi:hypothetical protein